MPASDPASPEQHENRQRRFETIGEIATGITSQLHTPLLAISSAAQLIRFRMSDDPVVEKNVGRILREVERLNGVVAAFAEYARPHPVRLVPGDPDTAWDRVLENERGRLESRALLLHRTRSSPAASCAIDVEQLSQALTALLANACDAAREGSDLTLRTSLAPDGGWHCELHDEGDPISPDILPRVFALFFSTRPGGIGLGLPLCRRVLDDHRGTVEIASAPGRGTTVTVTLPPVHASSRE